VRAGDPTTRQANTNESSGLDRQLQKAIGRADPDAVKSLLDRGADPNAVAPESTDKPALVRAVEGCWDWAGDRTGQRRRRAAEIVKLLLDRGANPNAAVPDPPGCTALVFAVYWNVPEVVELLIDRGAKTEPETGPNPLTMAAAAGDERLVRLLIAKGADVNGSPGRVSPLQAARRTRHAADLVAILIAAGAEDGKPATRPEKGSATQPSY
jgi:ankyrin repeat protein